jgi:hypothetical protein
MKGHASALNQPTLKEAVPAVSGFLELLAEQLLQAQLQAPSDFPRRTDPQGGRTAVVKVDRTWIGRFAHAVLV